MVHAEDVHAVWTAPFRHLAEKRIDVVGVAAEGYVVIGASWSKLPNGTVILWAGEVGQQVDEAQRPRIARANLLAEVGQSSKHSRVRSARAVVQGQSSMQAVKEAITEPVTPPSSCPTWMQNSEVAERYALVEKVEAPERWAAQNALVNVAHDCCRRPSASVDRTIEWDSWDDLQAVLRSTGGLREDTCIPRLTRGPHSPEHDCEIRSCKLG